MAEYIEREALRSEMYRQAFEENSPLQRWDSGCWIRCKMFEKAIDSAPAADVVPVRHGRWKPHSKVEVPVYHCSVCGGAALHAFGKQCKSDYCPNCGARMDKDGDGDV